MVFVSPIKPNTTLRFTKWKPENKLINPTSRTVVHWILDSALVTDWGGWRLKTVLGCPYDTPSLVKDQSPGHKSRHTNKAWLLRTLLLDLWNWFQEISYFPLWFRVVWVRALELSGTAAPASWRSWSSQPTHRKQIGETARGQIPPLNQLRPCSSHNQLIRANKFHWLTFTSSSKNPITKARISN